jgi:hypothetical protein
MDKVVIAGPKGKVTIDNLEASAAVTRVVSRQELAADPLLLLEVVRQANVVLKNLAVADKDDQVKLEGLTLAYGADQGQNLALALHKLTVAHQKPGRAKDFALEDFKVEVGLSRVLTRQEVAADWTVLLEALRKTDMNLKNLVYSDTQQKITLGGVNLATTGDKDKKIIFAVDGLNLNLPEVKISLEKYSNTYSLDPKNVVVYTDIILKDFLLAFPPAPKRSDSFAFMREMGYTSLKFNLDGKGTYNPQTLEDVSTMQLSGENMGILTLDLNGGGYRRPPLPLRGGLMELLDFAQQWEKAVDQFALSSLKIRYQDQGLVKRLLEMGGKAMGKNAKAFSQEIVNNINGTLMLFPLPQNLREQVKAVNLFITNPNEIEISLAFKKPLRLNSLKNPNPDQVLDLLAKGDFKITAR